MHGKFETAFLMSGGGTRLMIYLGMLAALEKLNRKPDVLIATCGGALAATVINTFPDTDSRKEYLKSRAYYSFVTQVQLTKEKKLWNIGRLSLRKMQNKRNAPFLEDLFQKYLVDMAPNLDPYLPALAPTTFSGAIPTLVIGAEILYGPKEVGQKRAHRKLFQKVIFTDRETAGRIRLAEIPMTAPNFTNSAVCSEAILKTDISMLQSTRISIADMFYIAPVCLEGKWLAGGAIDLIPIELARHLAHTVILEEKQWYSPIEEAFVRSVLGYSGNARLAEIKAQAPDFAIATSNIKEVLEGHYLKKKVYWKKLEIGFTFPASYERFRDDMDRQWAYGFEQTIKSISPKA